MKVLRKSNQLGFTLIELMVAVAIVGIGAAIAIPNYNKVVARGRQQEAKVALAYIYSIQRSFYLENQTYSACLTDIGLKRPTGMAFYTIGFNPAMDLTSLCGPGRNTPCQFASWNPLPSLPCAGANPSHEYILANAMAGGGSGIPGQSDIVSTYVERNAFIAGASGQIGPGQSKFDRWRIDQSKTLTQTADGT